MPKLNCCLRLIARLDIKGKNLIKGIHLEGLRVIGDPKTYAKKYYLQGADELIYMDSVASLYGRNQLTELVSECAKEIFVPITVGGGIRTVDNAYDLLRAGADKVAINTAAVANPNLLTDLSNRFGSQAVVLSIEAKKNTSFKWEVLTNNGRERTGMDVVEWAKLAISCGAGEILLTSVDFEGTRKGFDIELVRAISSSVNVPIIASGGMGKLEDILPLKMNCGADAIAMADILHYERSSIGEVREFARSSGFEVRDYV